MTELITHIRNTLATPRPTEQQLSNPRRYQRRETWVPVVGEKVTVWRIRQYDPDVQEDFPGVFVSADEDFFRVRIVGDKHVTPFPKRDPYGAKHWRLDSRGKQNQEMKK